MWIYLSSEELTLLQKGLNLLAEKTEEELEINKAKLWTKIQRRMESNKRMQKEKELKDENKR